MKQLQLIVGASVREQARWARQHLYSLLILTPMVLGGTYAAAVRAAGDAPEWSFSTLTNVLLAALFVSGLILLGLSRASADIFHLRRAESSLEALPVILETHFHAALMKRLSRAALVGIVVLIARSLIVSDGMFNASIIAALLLFVALTAIAEMLAALNWIHWGHARDAGAALTAALLLLPAVVLGALLLVLILKPVAALWNYRTPLLIGAAVWTVVLYLCVRIAHARWRAADIEYAKRLQSTERWSLFGVRFLRRRLEATVAAQLARDLQLTLRVFSSAVYVAATMAALSVMVLLTILLTGALPPATPEGWFDATQLPAVMAVKLTVIAATASLGSLVPMLVAHQIPRRWLERATGTTGEGMWEAKAWYARLVSLPAPLIVWAAGIMTGQIPAFYALPLLAECVWLWWMVSLPFALLSFEMPDEPGLALILMVTIGVGVGFSVALLWPLGLIYYVFGVPQMTERGHARAYYHLVQEED
ncbi:MAG: hypothetical protein M3430_22585 [Acidobacteriota bacterium]|nr:hypothetical protein [Acidobacteriota bacterium]